MGKRLIISGADFSTNGMAEPVEIELAIEQGGVNLTNDHSGNDFGRKYAANSGDVNFQKRITSEVVEVPLGASIKLSGVSGLRLDYCYYSQDFDIFTEYLLTSTSGASSPHPYVQGSASNKIATQYFPVNTSGDDTVTIINNTGYKYLAFVFAALNKTNVISADNFDIKYTIW